MRVATVFALFALLSVVAFAGPKWHQLEGYTFEQYQKDFGKTYKSDLEFDQRRVIFEENLELIRSHNTAGTSSYKMGVNQFTDRTKKELARVNGGKSRKMHRVAQELRKKPYVKTHTVSGAPLPDSVDWRMVSPSVLSAVKDQGDCGSCYAHGSTENIETFMALATGQMFALSTQEATACTPNPDQCGGTGGCGGGIAELVFDYVKNYGIAQEWTNPYLSYFGNSGNCSNTTTPMVWLDGYVKVAANDEKAVMDVIAHTGPLTVNVDASNWFMYESGVYDGCNYAKNISIDHVVQLVGYGRDAGLGKDYWLVRNSWNPTFGELGYIRVFRGNSTKPSCGWDVDPQDGTACRGAPDQLWVCGECGILFDTSYPIVKKH